MTYIAVFTLGYLLCFAIAIRHKASLKRRLKQADNAMFYLRHENKHLEGMLRYQRERNTALMFKQAANEAVKRKEQKSNQHQPGDFYEVEPGTFLGRIKFSEPIDSVSLMINTKAGKVGDDIVIVIPASDAEMLKRNNTNYDQGGYDLAEIVSEVTNA